MSLSEGVCKEGLLHDTQGHIPSLPHRRTPEDPRYQLDQHSPWAVKLYEGVFKIIVSYYNLLNYYIIRSIGQGQNLYYWLTCVSRGPVLTRSPPGRSQGSVYDENKKEDMELSRILYPPHPSL